MEPGTAVLRPNGLSYTGAQLDLIRRTLAKDCNADEFELFMAMAGRHGLDPIRGEICALVFSKDNPEKRQLAVIVKIDGYRRLAYQGVAQRGAELTPSGEPTEYEIDEGLKNPNTNPAGIVSCTVTWFVKDRAGERHPVTERVYWDEFAPLTEMWAYNEAAGQREPTGHFELPNRSPWRRMARVMIAKCCEAQVLRRVSPETLGGLYLPEEMDQSRASDLADQAAGDRRLERAGIIDTIPAILNGTGMEAVPAGQFADKILEHARACPDVAALDGFLERNRYGLAEFWGSNKTDALGLKRELEAMQAKLSKPTLDAVLAGDEIPDGGESLPHHSEPAPGGALEIGAG